MSLDFNETTIGIMGRPNFACRNVALRLIHLGIYPAPEKPKSEYEQAVFIHWCLGLYAKHGDKWGDEGQKILFPESDASKKTTELLPEG